MRNLFPISTSFFFLFFSFFPSPFPRPLLISAKTDGERKNGSGDIEKAAPHPYEYKLSWTKRTRRGGGGREKRGEIRKREKKRCRLFRCKYYCTSAVRLYSRQGEEDRYRLVMKVKQQPPPPLLCFKAFQKSRQRQNRKGCTRTCVCVLLGGKTPPVPVFLFLR